MTPVPSAAPPAWEAGRDGLALALVTAAALAVSVPIHDRWLSLLDEGAIVTIAEEITRGKVLYRDAVHVAMPGVFYLTAALFRLFGPSFLVGRWIMVGTFAALVALVYVLTRTVAGRGTALAAALLAVGYRAWAFPHWQMLSYTPLAIVSLMGGVALLAADLARPRPGRLALAGLAVGLAVVFKQDCGGLGLVGLTAFVWLDGRAHGGGLRRAVGFAAAAAVPPAAAILAFAPAGLVGEMLRQTVWFPLVAQPVWAPSLGGAPHPYVAFPPFWPPFAADEAIRKTGFFSYFPSLLLDLYWKDVFNHRLFLHTALPEVFVRGAYLLPYAVLAALGGREVWTAWVRREDAPLARRRLRLLLVFGAALLASFNRPRDWIHLMVLYPPTLVLLPVLVEVVAGVRPGVRRRLVLGLSAGALAILLVSSGALLAAARAHYATPLAVPRSGLRVDRDTATALGALLEVLAPPPGTPPAPLASFPYQPTVNFLARRPLASRFMTVLPLEEFPDRQEQILADLARDPRTEIVYGLQHLASIPRPQDYAPRLFAALVDRWRLGRVFSGTRADGQVFARLEPRVPRQETVLYDFAAHLGEARPPDAATLAMWPFERPVLVLVPAIAPERTAVAFTVDVPAGARLRFGAAMNPDEWTHFLPAALRFTVYARARVVFDLTLDPRRNFDDRRWEFADVALDPGRQEIRFEVSSENAYGAVGNLAGFAAPRLVAGAGG